MMGSPLLELGRENDEMRHKVLLTRDFYIKETEVTNEEMADVLNWALQNELLIASYTNVQNAEGDIRQILDLGAHSCQISIVGGEFVADEGKEDLPCVEVTWYGAMAYCNYLSRKEGIVPAVNLDDWTMDPDAKGHRLPTEAEWEYACRAATTTAFYTGPITQVGYSPVDPSLDLAGWYKGNSGQIPHAVGEKDPNPWGLYDMHGNVWELCWDWHLAFTSETVVDPMGPASGSRRVFRGGSYNYDASYCRSAFRGIFAPYSSTNIVGFRPVRTQLLDH
jgi:formylglycine-generating enzyme required for sulfatase activity